MSMIFPGMDPYLEDPQIWPGVHASFIVYLRDELQPTLRPRYIATVEERVWVEGPDREIIPDVWLQRSRSTGNQGGVALVEEDAPVIVKVPGLEVHETYVEILDRQSGQRVVTVIEVTSPANKFSGAGRNSYLDKQAEILQSQTHLVELDLLRAGPHVVATPEWTARGRGEFDYIISLNRASEGLRDSYEFYARTLRQRLPRIRIPLAEGDPDVLLDIRAVLEKTYDAGSYRQRLDYSAPCVPPLRDEDQAWADELIQNAKQITQA